MTTFKGMILPHHLKENGTIPAKIRITHERKTKYIPTKIVFYPDQYTKSFKLKNCTPKFQLDDLERKYTEKLSELGDKNLSIDDIIKFVTTENNVDRINFLEFYEKEISKIQNKGTAGLYQTSLNNLKLFTRGVLFADDIDFDFLERYSKYIAENTKGRAVSLYLGNLRSMFNRAKNLLNDEDMGLIRIPRNPFTKFKLPEQELTRKRAISIPQIKSIMSLPDNGTRWILARDIFMLSFYLIGMNTADLYSFEKLTAGRVDYERLKTRTRRKDKARISIDIQPEVSILIEKYKGRKLFFNFSENYTDKGTFNQAINKGLKLIGDELGIDDLEFYAARHSWATIAIKSDVDKYLVHECLNHSVSEMKVTDIYIDKDWSRLDRANRIVLDQVKWRVRKLKRFSHRERNKPIA